ncbi:MAG: hypothetical protein AAF804_10095 [Bacteroidota bacterium]
MSIAIEQLRNRYQEAVTDREEADALWRKLKRQSSQEALPLAYQASTRVLQANFTLMPLSKLAYLKEAMKLFRQAVKLDPENIEIRFLRYSIQYNLPRYLHESGDMSEDKAVIFRNLASFQRFHLDTQHLQSFLNFFEQHQLISEPERAQLQSLIS